MPFPYYVIGEGKIDLYWSLGEPILVNSATNIGSHNPVVGRYATPYARRLSLYTTIPRAVLSIARGIVVYRDE